MAIITGGITGSIQGRIGNVIGERWKGINYVKLYRKPYDPKSDAQLVQRNRFIHCNLFMDRMPYYILVWLIPFFTTKIPPRAVFTQWNIMIFLNGGWLGIPTLSKGNLEPVTFLDSSYNPTTGFLRVTWEFNPVGGQEKSDKVAVMVLCSDNEKWTFTHFDTTLYTGYADLEIGAGKSNFWAHTFLVLSRGLLMSLEALSNSSYGPRYFT